MVWAPPIRRILVLEAAAPKTCARSPQACPTLVDTVRSVSNRGGEIGLNLPNCYTHGPR